MGEYCHFDNFKASSSWTWDDFPLILTFNFFQWYCHFHCTSVMLLLSNVFLSILIFLMPLPSLRTSSAVWNRSGRSGHSCFVHELREIAISLSSLSMMLAVLFFINILHQMWKFCGSLTFYHERGYWIWSNPFSLSIEMIIWFFFYSVTLFTFLW